MEKNESVISRLDKATDGVTSIAAKALVVTFCLTTIGSMIKSAIRR